MRLNTAFVQRVVLDKGSSHVGVQMIKMFSTPIQRETENFDYMVPRNYIKTKSSA